MKKVLTILLVICYSCTLFSQNSMNDTIIARGEISISSLNPTTDDVIITVTNEDVYSVAVYSVVGSLVASSESNVVNVANLVNGIYFVKANTEAGVIMGIIKKGSVENSIKDKKEKDHVKEQRVNKNKANTEAGVIMGIIKKGSVENSIKDKKEKDHVKEQRVNKNKAYYKSNESYKIYVGPRGGRYYINKNGNKTYIKRK